MSRVFSVRTVLRQTSNNLLRQLLDQLEHTRLNINWGELDDKDIEPIHRALKTLPAVRYDEVEGILRTIFDLACETGIAAIHEAVTCLDIPAALTGFPSEDGLYNQALWAWLHRREAVELADLIHRIENFSWWRRRDDLPRLEPDASPETLRRLESELSTLLETEQGRGRNCTVEVLARTRTRYYFAYPDDYVQNVTTHDDRGKLIPRTFRRTFSVVFAFDPADGVLELYAGRLSPRLKQQIEKVFARVVFGVDLAPWAKPTYELDRLKFRSTPLATDPADRVEMSIRQMRLKIRGTQRQVTLTADPNRGPGGIYDMMDEVLNSERVPLSAVDVTLVSFCLEFLDAPRGRGRTLTFDVASPNTCSLRNQRQDRIDLAMKCLARWGIYAQHSDPGVAAVG
jgi:hypothetical protein